MLQISDLDELLRAQHHVLLDGGLATELEARGHDLAHPLWSGKILREDPTAIKQVHLDYFLAGANIVITASYQASTRGLLEHFALSEQVAKDLIRTSVTLANQARTEAYQNGIPATRKLLVAGSVGPYGAYLADGSEYNGEYTISQEDLKVFHRPRLQVLIEAGVDVLAIETIPSFNETQAIIDLLRDEFPTATSWISCTLRDARHLADGTAVDSMVNLIEGARPHVVAFGVNCVPPSLVVDFLLHARELTDIPLICYPNSGEEYDPVSKTWVAQALRSKGLVEDVVEWCRAGARMIGGCCRTTPADTKVMREACQYNVKSE